MKTIVEFKIPIADGQVGMSRSYIYLPETHYSGKGIKWYKDKVRKGEGQNKKIMSEVSE